jgi:hypothetical protein
MMIKSLYYLAITVISIGLVNCDNNETAVLRIKVDELIKINREIKMKVIETENIIEILKVFFGDKAVNHERLTTLSTITNLQTRKQHKEHDDLKTTKPMGSIPNPNYNWGPYRNLPLYEHHDHEDSKMFKRYFPEYLKRSARRRILRRETDDFEKFINDPNDNHNYLEFIDVGEDKSVIKRSIDNEESDMNSDEENLTADDAVNDEIEDVVEDVDDEVKNVVKDKSFLTDNVDEENNANNVDAEVGDDDDKKVEEVLSGKSNINDENDDIQEIESDVEDE